MVLFHLGQKSFTILTGSVCALCIQGAAQVLSSPYKLSSIALSTSLCIDVCKDVTDMKKSTFSIVTFYLLFFPLQRELFYDNKFYLTCVILAVCPMSFVFLYLYVDISEIQNANKLIWSLAHTFFHLVRHHSVTAVTLDHNYGHGINATKNSSHNSRSSMHLIQLNATKRILSGVLTPPDILVIDSSMLIFLLSQTASTADEKHHQWRHLMCWILHCPDCHTATGYDL